MGFADCGLPHEGNAPEHQLPDCPAGDRQWDHLGFPELHR